MKRVYIDNDGDFFEGLEAEVVEQVEDNLANAGYFEAVEKETKGDNKMSKLFKKTGKVVVTTFDKRDGTIKRKAKVVKDIAVMSIKGTFSDPLTYAAAGSVGLQSGLKYKGDAKHGSKAGLATAAVLAGINVAGNIVANMDVIKDA